MRRRGFKIENVVRMLWGISLGASLWIAGTCLAHGQFTQNKKDKIIINSSVLPVDIHKGYRLFVTKCGECHGLDTSLKPSMMPAQWNSEVKRMQGMASSQFNDDQATSILRFLNYDEVHRKAGLKPAVAEAAPSDSIGTGHQFYVAQGCDGCHSIAGNGGTLKSLDGVGSRLSRPELLQALKTPSAGSAMPPMPPEATEAQIDHLLDFLQTLKAN